ncbi:MAG: hypothetical protein JJT88_20905 [Gammaproteobacteria bacterium]|nr:hypothetical protein [Gammaproteobacteria bacterium]
MRVTAVDAVEVITPAELTKPFLLERQATLYQNTLYRTYAIRVKDGLKLCRDAEMLVGDSDLTYEADIVGLFGRFVLPAGIDEKLLPLDDFLPRIDETDVNTYLTDRFHWNGTFNVKRRPASLSMVFKFDEDRRRKHLIRVSYRRGCCYFEATVADWSVVDSFSAGKLLRCTWLRNRNIDLVGFLVRPDGCLIARAMHPAYSLTWEELIFTAFVLAVEADRMEYLIKEEDEY